LDFSLSFLLFFINLHDWFRGDKYLLRRESMLYWLLLLLAIVSEIIGTLAMKWASASGENTGYIFMLSMITLSYIFLTFAVKRIALGVAYAIWEGIGIALITLFSIFLFGESLSPMKAAGLLTLIAGIILIKLGTFTTQEDRYVSI